MFTEAFESGGSSLVLLVVVVIAYILGNLPFSYIITRIFTNKDIREHGSGNVGATNAYRTSGWATGLLSLLGDLLKGALAAWTGLLLAGYSGAMLASWAVVIGHCYPVALRFKGGKGVASAAGVLFILSPGLIIPLVLIFVGIVYFSRYISLASIGTAYFLPFLIYYSQQPWQYLLLGTVMAAFVIYRHKDNIIRLRNGQENKFTLR